MLMEGFWPAFICSYMKHAASGMDPDLGTLRGGAVNPKAWCPSPRVPARGRVAPPAAVLGKQRRRVHTRSAAAQAREPNKKLDAL